MSRARAVAVRCLARVDQGAYANLLLPPMLREARLSQRDRSLVTELVYGTVREQRGLDELLQRVSRRPLESLEPDVRAALRLGAYQLVHGVAPHAAVGETVGAVEQRARGFANGVLRSLAREDLPSFDDPAFARSTYPDWIVAELIGQFGEADAVGALAAMNRAPVMTLRVNPRRAVASSVQAECEAAGARVERGTLVDDALLVRGSGDPAMFAPIAAGRATPQDQASQVVARLAAPDRPGHVLDVASAPGGKATAIAEIMEDRGLVVAADVTPGRLRRVREAGSRLGLRSVAPLAADGRRLPFADASFDAVLLDAPCSGLGVLRRRPDARHRVGPSDVADLAAIQRALLVDAARVVRPGGRVVYSVCTLTAAETTAIDEFAATALPELVAAAPPEAPWRRCGRGAVVLPHDAETDGMFVLVLERAVGAAADARPTETGETDAGSTDARPTDP